VEELDEYRAVKKNPPVFRWFKQKTFKTNKTVAEIIVFI